MIRWWGLPFSVIRARHRAGGIFRLSCAAAGLAASCLTTLKLDWFLGGGHERVMALSVWAARVLAAQTTDGRLSPVSGLSFGRLGISIIGSFWGKVQKPAFIDDVPALIIGHCFVRRRSAVSARRLA